MTLTIIDHKVRQPTVIAENLTFVIPHWPTTEQIEPGLWLVKLAVEWQAENEAGHIPTGFKTDFASTPRFLWSIFPPQAEYSMAAIVHDNLYRSHDVPRKKADRIFRSLMQHLEVPAWKISAMYRAVRWFGGGPYKRAFNEHG